MKPTKTRTERDVALDDEMTAMLARILEHRRDVAAFVGVSVADDPYLFSHAADSSTPMPPDYVTKRVAVRKGHLGIENKQPATIAAEDEALTSSTPDDSRLDLDAAVERFLTGHLRDERGREDKTIRDYRSLHRLWFSRDLGRRLVRNVDRASSGNPVSRCISVRA